MNKFEKNTRRKERYHVHLLAALVVSLLTVNLAIQFWPDIQRENKGLVFDAKGQNVIQMEEIEQTRQEKKKPAPPIPAPPIVVPDDVVLDDLEIEITDTSLTLEDPGNDTEVVEGTNTGNATVAARADKSPSPVRISIPEYTREARRKGIRARILIEVLVNERGRVSEARITELYLLNKDKTERERVTELGYGIEEASLVAARKHQFSPARQNGKKVSSYVTLTFEIGV
ncbi:MAG: energy transducer TonB [Bacteroidetes Order II. Incertae sedis bacterium]|nr:energy transducer TonB [Bacteroidetes Order II. bacterium]MBT4601823.1 energy transducer TonB [Bacteroidetes Order II. bacterium]MBT5250160.1 energy transducer TonB [Bacteroidetes Order II. bacterium]MBT6201889.1 energy transducer TonB [Bacteroidetes Order II. bacterium]MBT6424369.1 energy transducer TonB [Bacteroidetes Order II. bacterium]